jgi:hypothetical protein
VSELASLGSLLAKIGLDTGPLKEGAEKAKGILHGGLVEGVAAAGGAVAAAATVVAGFGLESAHTFADVGKEVLKLQRYTGGTAEEMSRLRFAGEETGVDTDKLAKSMGFLSKNLVAGKTDWKGMGVEVKDAHGAFLPMNDVLLNVADKFSKMPAGVERNALVLKAFGKAGMDMIPFLSRGKEGLQELMKESDKFGLTLSGSNLSAIKENVKAHREFHAAMQGMQVQIGQYVLPVLTKVTAAFVEHLVPAIKVAGQLAKEYLAPAFDAAFGLIGNVVGNVVDVVRSFVDAFSFGPAENETKRLGSTVDGVGGQIQAAVRVVKDAWATLAPHIEAVRKELQAVFDKVIAGLAHLVGLWQDHHSKLHKAVEDMLAKIGPYLDRIVQVYSAAFELIAAIVHVAVAAIEVVWDHFGHFILEFLQSTFNNVFKVVIGAFDVIVGVFHFFADLFTGKWGKLWGDLKEIFHGLWEIVLGVINEALAILHLAWEGALSLLELAWSGLWSRIKEAASGAWHWIETNVINPLLEGINLVIKGLNLVKPGADIPQIALLGSHPSTEAISTNPAVAPSGARQGRAAGGPIDAFKPYIVNEHRGPGGEIFTPSMSGVLTPRTEGGGGVHYSSVINIGEASEEGVARLQRVLTQHSEDLAQLVAGRRGV